ncbi:MAG: proton-conducting transporter membrane subunit [Dissulfuribacterales bacterium]
MQTIFLSILLLSTVPVAAIAFYKQPDTAKKLGTAGILLGCIMGLWSVWHTLNAETIQSITWNWQHILIFSISIDRLSAFFLLTIFLITAASAVYGFHYLNETEKRLRTLINQALLGILASAMALVVIAHDMITFLLAWELMSISSCFLVVYDYEQKETRHAAYIYFIFTQAGALFIFAAFALLHSLTGSFSLTSGATLPESTKLLVFLLAFIGFASKAGVFPLHIWLPHAHPAAPSHVSAIMSGVMIKMGIYGILRLYVAMGPNSIVFGRTILGFGIVSGILGVLYAMGQHNLKRLLAYHSIENIGIILIGIGLGMTGASLGNQTMAFLGFTGGLMHVLNHAIFKALLFMGAGSVSHGAGTLAIDRLGGLMKRMRITGITFLVGSIAICGLPPLNGFVSEFFIYNAAFQSRTLSDTDFLLTLLAVISLAVIGGLAVGCFTKVIGIVFLGEPRTPNARHAHEASPSMRYAMQFLATLCLAIGFLPTIFARPALLAANSLATGLKTQPITALLQYQTMMKTSLYISWGAVLFALSCALFWWLRTLAYKNKPLSFTCTWGCGYTKASARIQYTGSSFAASILEFFRPFAPVHEEIREPAGVFPTKARYHSFISDIAETFAVQRIAIPTVRFMRSLRWIQQGSLQVYIGYIVLAILILLVATWLWR